MTDPLEVDMPTSREAARRKRQAVVDQARRVIAAMKLSAGCCECGYREHASALHFDHRDPATKLRELGWRDDSSKLTSHAKLAAYLDHVDRYCDVRCANCHAVRTVQERHWSPCTPHDSLALRLF